MLFINHAFVSCLVILSSALEQVLLFQKTAGTTAYAVEFSLKVAFAISYGSISGMQPNYKSTVNVTTGNPGSRSTITYVISAFDGETLPDFLTLQDIDNRLSL